MLRKGRQIRDSGETRIFRMLWVFLSEASIGRDVRFQHLMVSRFFSDAAQEALTYGSLVAVVQRGGSAAEVALVGVARLLPPALFGLYGGTVADATLKRVALGLGYGTQAALCFVVPIFFGTGLLEVMVLLFLVHTLGQLSGPAESAIVPFVTTEKQFANAASFLRLVSGAGTGFGTALLAPILVSVVGIEPVMYTAGFMLLLAATRVFDLSTTENGRAFDRRKRHGVRSAVDFVAGSPAVATMIAVAVVAGSATTVVQMMGPAYVSAVLHLDAANAVYVFAPSALGLLTALALLPASVRFVGERRSALAGLSVIGVALVALGAVDTATDVLEPVNAVRLFDSVGLQVNDRLGAVSLVAMALGFGAGLTSGSVQTYINRRVPLGYQSRTFAMQSSVRNGVAIIPLLTLGAAATAFGVENVLVTLPALLVVVAVALLWVSERFGRAHQPVSGVLASFWAEPSMDGRLPVPPDGSLGVLMEAPGGTESAYSAVVSALSARGAWPPEGRLSHVAGPMIGGWRVVETWASEEEFESGLHEFMRVAEGAGLSFREPDRWLVYRSEP